MNAPFKTASVRGDIHALLGRLGVASGLVTGGSLAARSPITGEQVAEVHEIDPAAAAEAIERAHLAYLAWRKVPAPRRGELVRFEHGPSAKAPGPEGFRLKSSDGGRHDLAWRQGTGRETAWQSVAVQMG